MFIEWIPLRGKCVEISKFGSLSRGVFSSLSQHHAPGSCGSAMNLRGSVVRPRFVIGAGVCEVHAVRTPFDEVMGAIEVVWNLHNNFVGPEDTFLSADGSCDSATDFHAVKKVIVRIAQSNQYLNTVATKTIESVGNTWMQATRISQSRHPATQGGSQRNGRVARKVRMGEDVGIAGLSPQQTS